MTLCVPLAAWWGGGPTMVAMFGTVDMCLRLKTLTLLVQHVKRREEKDGGHATLK